MNLEKANIASATHFFFFSEAAKHMQDMCRYMFDLSEQGGRKYDAASKAFDESLERSRKAYQDFQLYFRDAIGDDEATGKD